jgi:hypothetical protein
MKVNDKIVYFFNKIFYDLLKDLNNIDNDIITDYCSNFKVKNLESTKNIKLFDSSLKSEYLELIIDTDSKNVFDIEEIGKILLFKDFSFTIIKNNAPQEYHTTLKYYMYCLILITLIYRESMNEENEEDSMVLFTNVVNCIRNIESNTSYSDIIDSIYDKNIKKLIAFIDECNVSNLESRESGESSEPKEMPDIFQNSTIGSLAKEISDEINIGDFSIEKPDDIMKLMSGDIISKVGEKIQKKMSSGEIKQDQLLAEAMSMLGNMGKGCDIFNNPMIKQMMNNQNMKINESKLKNMTTKQRLKNKLDKKL